MMIDTVCKRYHSLAHFSLYILHARRPEPECSGWGQVTAAPRSISARLLAVLPCNNKRYFYFTKQLQLQTSELVMRPLTCESVVWTRRLLSSSSSLWPFLSCTLL